MLFFMFECKPAARSVELATYGGAFVNCWVDEDNLNKAERMAKEVIASEGWEVTQVEEAYPIRAEDYENNEEGLRHYYEAQVTNLALVFCTWPVGEC